MIVFKVFYSWQSDLPNRTNRNLILTSLEKACSRLKSQGGVLAEAVVDRDTLGLPGAPSINDAILAKIRDTDAFVADVSVINGAPSTVAAGGALRNYAAIVTARIAARFGDRAPGAKSTPNPNVMAELGYAMAQLGNEALVLVVNTYYGNVEQLPFDLRHLRTLTYRAGPGDDTSATKKSLESDLAEAIKSIGGAARADPVDSILYERTRAVAGQARGLFFELVRAADATAGAATEQELNERFSAIAEEKLAVVCSQVNPNGEAPLFLTPTGVKANWIDYLKHWRQRSGALTREILAFSPFLKREHAALLMRIEHCSYFNQLEFVNAPIRNQDLSWISADLWKYFQLARALEHYTHRELARRARPF